MKGPCGLFLYSSCVEGNLLGIVNIRRDFWEKIQSLIHGKPSDRNCST